MNRRSLIRNLMLGALIAGVAPLTGAGARLTVAAAAESPAALCQSTFGEGGPAGGAIVGEGPSGDPMSTTIGWDPADWPDGLSEIITCVSVGGRAVPALTSSKPTPRNDGSLVISLTLPPGEPGSLACEQSVLVGAGDANGKHRTTGPVCFKLRAPEPPLGSNGPVAAPPPAPAPAVPANPPASAPKAPVAAPLVPYPASTPPARAAFEAARGGVDLGAARDAGPDPRLSVGVPPPVWPNPAASPAPAAKATARPAAAAGATATTQPKAAATGAPSTSLARTGLEHHIPLAGAGGFLAIGGAAIIFGAPRGRRSARRSA
jgi:hypothetical protein